MARLQLKVASTFSVCTSDQRPTPRPVGAPRQISNATSCGNCSRASVSIDREAVMPVSKGTKPEGNTIHMRTAKAKPQINPAPALVARFEKNKPNTAPKRMPLKSEYESESANNQLCSAPPDAPVRSPIRTAVARGDAALMLEFTWIADMP